MATLGFFMLSEPGHLNGPVKLAKSLQAHGHRTYFFGLSESEDLIREAGVPFIPVLDALRDYRPSLGSLIRRLSHMIESGTATPRDWAASLDQAVAAVFAPDERLLAKEALNEFTHTLRTARLGLCFVDYFLPAMAWLTTGVGINTAILNVTLAGSPGSGENASGSRVDFGSLLNVPVVYLCPSALELQEVEANGSRRYYIEPSIDLARRQAAFEWSRVDSSRPLLLCSFGSQGRVYVQARRVIQAVIDTMADKPEWQAILSLGGVLGAEEFSEIPANVIVSSMLPQLEALTKASIMITHGGLNSVKECIFFGVPMIVVPFDVDQPLNARRVVHHGLGLMADPETVSPQQLRSMIERIENDDSFRTRINVMKSCFQRSEESGVGVNAVRALLNEPD
jgi:UDP:flavonoid glycosyltransferase YjiC (YdhE family)